ncbi:hypothetical protein KM043_012567 [Ampulex compressa]|nr:hypothetical protein KM043_012567 [Ampulex compressa]
MREKSFRSRVPARASDAAWLQGGSGWTEGAGEAGPGVGVEGEKGWFSGTGWMGELCTVRPAAERVGKVEWRWMGDSSDWN